jgi:uncharacterized SAM-dependent methyltransferase
MHYYKNTELADIYGVSRRTATNWIEQTKSGRLDLELYEYNDKAYIARTPKNQVLITSLVRERRKFLNTRSLRVVRPLPRFYEVYGEKHILEIISELDRYKEIPLQFSYLGDGASVWDAYAHQMSTSTFPNSLTGAIKLLNNNIQNLDMALEEYDHINIIDVGVGNALPSKDIIAHLLDSGKLKRYVAIDISREMLTIAKKNIKQWFKGKVAFEGYVRDISTEPFTDLIVEAPKPEDKTINLVMLLGGTLANFRSPQDVLKVICKSMGRNDIFAYTLKLDSKTTREQHFGFYKVPFTHSSQLTPARHQLILDLLGVDEGQYSIETGYDKTKRARYMQIRLKHAMTIEFELSQGMWQLEFNKDDTILLLRALHFSAFDIVNTLYENGFNPLLTSQTTDHDYMLILADLRKDGH